VEGVIIGKECTYTYLNIMTELRIEYRVPAKIRWEGRSKLVNMHKFLVGCF